MSINVVDMCVIQLEIIGDTAGIVQVKIQLLLGSSEFVGIVDCELIAVAIAAGSIIPGAELGWQMGCGQVIDGQPFVTVCRRGSIGAGDADRVPGSQ